MQVGSNQIEIYFSVVQRKVLTPNDFDSADVENGSWPFSVTIKHWPDRSSGPSHGAIWPKLLAKLAAPKADGIAA
jgi:hypothetical protein